MLITARPRLLTPGLVLRRGPDRLQVGTPPGPTLVLNGVPDALAGILERADGTRTLATLQRSAPSLGDELAWALAQLCRAGLVSLDPPRPPSKRAAVIGSGRLAKACAALLHDTVADLDLLPTPGGATPEDGAGLGSRRCHVRTRAAGDLHPATSLAIVCADEAVADRGTLDLLGRRGIPHLVAALAVGGPSVGPLVKPGLSPCVHCDDLHLAGCDPAWPLLAAQLSHVQAAVSEAATGWAATTVALAVPAIFDGDPSPFLGQVLQLGPGGRLLRRALRAHPACACAALTGARLAS